jgi:hypothetical protein
LGAQRRRDSLDFCFRINVIVEALQHNGETP